MNIKSFPAAFLAMLTAFTSIASAAETGPTNAPRVFLQQGMNLQLIRRQIRNGDRTYAPAIAALERDAQTALQARPGSVMDKPSPAASGDKHDYMSQAPYAWADPSKTNGLPYLIRDGQRNPEAKINSDYDHLWKMAWDTETLSLAYYLTGKEIYAARAARLIQTWFLDPATRMNPNVEYAQRVPGSNREDHGGIIDGLAFPLVVDSTGLLAGSPSWTDADERGFKEWIARYRTWLEQSTMGRGESQATNNHGTYYDVQLVTYSLFLGDEAAAKSRLEADKKRIAWQIQPDGRQPFELTRTISLHYSVYNLRGLFMLARLGENVGVDLWHYQTDDGRGISRAIDYLIPFVTGAAKWPNQQIAEYPMEKAYTVLRLAPLKYPDQRYRDMVAKFPQLDPASRDNLLIPKTPDSSHPAASPP